MEVVAEEVVVRKALNQSLEAKVVVRQMAG